MSNISYEVVVKCYGSEPNLIDDMERAAFFAIWALLEVELEGALVAAKNRRDTNARKEKGRRRLERLQERNKAVALSLAVADYANKNPHQTQARKVTAGIQALAREYYNNCLKVRNDEG